MSCSWPCIHGLATSAGVRLRAAEMEISEALEALYFFIFTKVLQKNFITLEVELWFLNKIPDTQLMMLYTLSLTAIIVRNFVIKRNNLVMCL